MNSLVAIKEDKVERVKKFIVWQRRMLFVDRP